MDTTQSTYNKIKSNEAEYCGKVPLHQTNQIQPHGVLLVLEKKTLNILQASENTEQLFGIKVTSMVNAPLVSFVSSRHTQTLQERLEQSIEARLPLLVTINKKDFLMMVNAFETYMIAEFERVETNHEQNSFVDIYHEVKYAMAEIDKMTTTYEACQVIANELKRISGFDKVMIYQFDADWNGEVVAEAMEEGIESYLGLKFPASDIPPQARELYKKTPYRLIPNIDYDPVKLYPVINPLTGAFIDLTNSSFRSVAAVHLEYLKNMGVSASMSTRILKDGVLWGLISCHHRTPKYVSYQVCSLFEMLSSLITSKITAVQNADIFEYKSRTHGQLNNIMERIYRKSDLVGGFVEQFEEVRSILQSDGIAVCSNSQIEIFGNTPAKDEIEDLVFWLQANDIQQVYHQPALSTAFDNALHYTNVASGLLALPIHADKGVFVLAFRKEAVQHINWGGNPNEAIQFEKNSTNYHPRNSFKLWQETVYNRSNPWREEELEMANHFRNLLIAYVLHKS